MKTVVITGSTRGIGRGLAENFLKRGCNVVLSGRQQQTVDAAIAELAQADGKLTGKACDINSPQDLQALWDHAKSHFGAVDIWINNAGISIKRGPLHEASFEDLTRIVDTNVKAVLYACKVAISGMTEQGHGQIWNMEGFGSNGSTQPGMASYGATKRAVDYLNKALRKDLKDSPIQICALSPGIVVTDLLMDDYDRSTEQWEKAKKIFNILGDHVSTVTPWLAQEVLATQKTGARVAWLTGGKAFSRFATAAFRKRDLFTELESASR